MNLSLVSQKPSAATTLGVLAALRAASGDGHYFTEITVAQPDRWQPSKEEAAILLLEDEQAIADTLRDELVGLLDTKIQEILK